MAQTIELEDVISSGVDVILQGLWTAMPGRVESYDAPTQTASVQLTIKTASIGEKGDRVVDTIAVLNSVPVLHLGGGGFRQVFPVKPGDTALVVFVNRNLPPWLTSGGIVDPGSDHHHKLTDGVAIVGLRDHKHSLQNAPTDRMSIGKDDGPTIEITDTEIRLGGNDATEKVVLQGALQVFMNALSEVATNLSSTNPLVAAGFTALYAEIKLIGEGTVTIPWGAGSTKVKGI